MDCATVLAEALGQRLEIGVAQGPVEVRSVVAQVELPVDEPDVGLDGREPVVECVQQRAVVLVVVVGVSALQRLHARALRRGNGGDDGRCGRRSTGRGSGGWDEETRAEQRGEQDGWASGRHT